MMLEELLYSLLSPLAPTTPFASADPTKDPRITYFTVTDNDHAHLNGPGPREARVQIDVWGTDFKAIRLLAENARVALQSGARVGSVTGNPDRFDAQTKFHSTSFDILVWP